MSDKKKAKQDQGYEFDGYCCPHCIHLKTTPVESDPIYGTRNDKLTLRCGIGGFKVKKRGFCKRWSGA